MTKIIDIVKRVYSGGTPDTRKNDYWNGNIKWLSSGETRNNFVYDTDKKITELGVTNSSTKLALKGSIVMACAGQGVTRGQTSYLMDNMYINQSVICIEPDENKVDGLYLYYFFKNNYQLLRTLSDDHSSRGSITTAMIKEFEVDFPDISVQKRISSLLYSLDQKIELNNKINNNLLQLSVSRLQELDVDNYSTLFSLSDVISKGTTPTTSDMKSYSDRSIKFIKVRDFVEYYVSNKEIEHIPKEVHEGKLKRSILKENDLLLSIAGTLGKVAYVDENLDNSNTNQAVAFIRLKDITNLGYLYFYLQTKAVQEEINIKQVHAVQPNFSLGMLGNIEVPILNDIEKKEYNVSFSIIKNNVHQNEILSELRDTLLPKLMNGEIDLDKIEI